MKLLYKPFSIIAGLLGARVGHEVFKTVWERLSDSPKQPPSAARQSLARVAGAAALEAALIAGSQAASRQLAARAFHQLVGAWPEKQIEKTTSEQP